jgi:putative phosphoribosyl transferase
VAAMLDQARGRHPIAAGGEELPVEIEHGGVRLEGALTIPEGAGGLVLFAHGSGSSRHSPRNRRVAERLRAAGFATLLFDLLSAEEGAEDEATARLRFDVHLLATRLLGAAEATRARPETRALRPGYFGASTGAAAALIAAAMRPDLCAAVVSRGGRPDLAGDRLAEVAAPTLLIVGGDDTEVLALNRRALGQIGGHRELLIVPDATHLFEETGALEEVARAAAEWFTRYLTPEARVTTASTRPPPPPQSERRPAAGARRRAGGSRGGG